MPTIHARQPPPLGGAGRTRVLRAWIAWWLLCAALWLALIDGAPLAGLLTGVVAAALGASTAVLVRLGRRTLVRPTAVLVAALGFSQRSLPLAATRAVNALRAIHNGRARDYVAWTAGGAVALAGLFAVSIR